MLIQSELETSSSENAAHPVVTQTICTGREKFGMVVQYALGALKPEQVPNSGYRRKDAGRGEKE